jgi:hypothetical protein
VFLLTTPTTRAWPPLPPPQSEAADAETAAEAAALVAPGDAQLAAALGSSELAPRVSALCMLRAWVEAARGGGPDGGGAAAAAAAAAAGDSWRCLLALARSDPELGAARYTPLSTTHRKKVPRSCHRAAAVHRAAAPLGQVGQRGPAFHRTALSLLRKPCNCAVQVRLWQALCVLSPAVPEDEVEEGGACRRCRQLLRVTTSRRSARCPCFPLLLG